MARERIALAVAHRLIGLGTAILVVLGPAAHVPKAQEPTEAIALPVRRSAPAANIVAPPAIPTVADTLPPLTLAVTMRWEHVGSAPRIARQTVLRTSDRVLVVTDGTKSEWLFERNPVDTRRVSGYLIDHATRRILIHQESDLRGGQQIRGWLDVLTLRFDAGQLKTLRATGDTQSADGATFAHYASEKRAVAGAVDVWWSEALLLPRRLIVHEAGGTVTSTIDALAQGVNLSKLAPPATRFPSYRVLDVTDAREGGER